MAKGISVGSPVDSQLYDQVFPSLMTEAPTYPYTVRPRLYEAYYYGSEVALANVNDFVTIQFSKEYSENPLGNECMPFALVVGGFNQNYTNNMTIRMFDSCNGSTPGEATQFNCEGGIYPIQLNRPNNGVPGTPRALVGNNWSNPHPALWTATMSDVFNFKFTLTAKDEVLGTHTVVLTQWLTGQEGTVYTTTLGYLGGVSQAGFNWVDPTLVVGNPRAFFDPYADAGVEPTIVCPSLFTVLDVSLN